MKKVKLTTDNKGGFFVNIGGITFGILDRMDSDGLFCFFPRRHEKLTGDHYIAIGEALNNINNKHKAVKDGQLKSSKVRSVNSF